MFFAACVSVIITLNTTLKIIQTYVEFLLSLNSAKATQAKPLVEASRCKNQAEEAKAQPKLPDCLGLEVLGLRV